MPPKSAKASAKKAAPKAAAVAARKKPTSSQFKTGIHKLVKSIHPKHSVSKKAMAVLNSFAIDTFNAICHEASQLVSRNGGKTLGGREIECATRILLPGELALHAGNEGAKAVANYSR